MKKSPGNARHANSASGSVGVLSAPGGSVNTGYLVEPPSISNEPEVRFGFPVCPRCRNGQVLRDNKCLACGAEYGN